MCAHAPRQQDRALGGHPVLKETEQLWRLFYKIWQQKNGCLLLLLSLCVTATVLWAMSKSILPPSNDSEHDRQMHRRQLQEVSIALSSEAPPFSSTQGSHARAGQLSSLLWASHISTRDTLRGHALPFMSDSSLKVKGRASKTVGKAHMPWVAASAAAHAASMATTSLSTVHGIQIPKDGRLPESSHSHSGSQLNGRVASSNRAFRPPGKFVVGREDLVAAMPSDSKHDALIQASNAWRQELKSFIAVDSVDDSSKQHDKLQHQEVRMAWPVNKAELQTLGCLSWDARVALTPFLAHQEYQGKYEWMLYGHDDTFFFVDSVLELLQDFDPALPYIITDHLWWSDEPSHTKASLYHPHEAAPHCMPCHWTSEDEVRALRAVDSYRPFAPYSGCPCTTEAICRNDSRQLYGTSCDGGLDPLPVRVHIGAGALISKGLLEKLPLSFMQNCIQNMPYAPGANMLFSHCVQKAGYAFTSPGFSFYHWEAKAFDPGPEGSLALMQALQNAAMGTADDTSLDVISHVISSHVEVHQQGIHGAAQNMVRLQAAYAAWRAALSLTQQSQ